jgi:hypothetical protein
MKSAWTVQRFDFVAPGALASDVHIAGMGTSIEIFSERMIKQKDTYLYSRKCSESNFQDANLIP